MMEAFNCKYCGQQLIQWNEPHLRKHCTEHLKARAEEAEQRIAELERTLEAFVDNENQLMEEATG